MAPSRGQRSIGKRRVHSISHGRPPTVQKPIVRSSKATSSIIRTHHRLQKARAAALASRDDGLVAQIDAQMLSQGGLRIYQDASMTGQSASRGGDSSKVLVEWCRQLQLKAPPAVEFRPRLLEIGALSTTNACSKSGFFEVTRIDLRSQGNGILEQDFMQRPLPTSEDEKFDAISLSLVLNFVPDASGRAEMLNRTREFLRGDVNARKGCQHEQSKDNTAPVPIFPLLFIVIPGPCLTNSRYLDQHRFQQIMNSLGFVLIQEKMSSKLAYSLWRFLGGHKKQSVAFPKVEINPGKTRNNFVIVT